MYQYLNKKNTELPNKDLLERLYNNAKKVEPYPMHVKGHSGDYGNEIQYKCKHLEKLAQLSMLYLLKYIETKN